MTTAPTLEDIKLNQPFHAELVLDDAWLDDDVPCQLADIDIHSLAFHNARHYTPCDQPAVFVGRTPCGSPVTICDDHHAFYTHRPRARFLCTRCNTPHLGSRIPWRPL